MQPREAPTVNDFLARLYTLRDEAGVRAREEANATTTRNAARGLLRSGATLTALASLIEREFDSTLSQMLEVLHHIRSLPDIDYQTCREQTFLRAKDLIAVLIGACDMEKWYAMIGRGSAADVIRARLDALFPKLQYRMRQFEVGLDQSRTNGGANVTNNVINAHTISGVVQQAGEGATLNASAELNFGSVADATSALEAEIAQAGEPLAREIRQITSDVAVIRAQLAAPEPRTSIIREAGKSIRQVAEQAIGGALSPSIIAAAITLGSLVS